jgi:hypothetical protein
MTEPEQPTAPGADPTVRLVQGPEARKLLKLAKRVNARKGSAVGLLAVVADRLRLVHGLYLRAMDDNTAITQEEVKLLQAFVKRLERRTQELAQAKVSGMQEIVGLLDEASRQLDEADKGGYGIRGLQRQAEIDRRGLDRLRSSIKIRVREGAAVLAELEQAVDPVPGMRLVSGRIRAKNAKLRKAKQRQVPLPPGVTREQIAPGPPPAPEGTASQFLAALEFPR